MKIIERSENSLIIETDNENFLKPLVDELLGDGAVEFAGAIKEHPLRENVRLIVRTKSDDVVGVVERAIGSLQQKIREMKKD